MIEVLYYAIPFFVLLLVVEALSFRHYHEDDLVGYEVNDTRTSITMGLGNVVVNVAWKAVVVVIYAAVYELTPLRIPEDAWWAWILLFFLDDLAYRLALNTLVSQHAVRLDGARVAAELNDPGAIRALAAAIAAGDTDDAHARARELLERSAR